MDIIKSEGEIADKSSETIKEQGIHYQPWIFEIEKATVISGENSNDKLISIDLIDIISAKSKTAARAALCAKDGAFLFPPSNTIPLQG